MVFVWVRAMTWATLFIGFVLVFLPSRLLARSGLSSPESLGAPQVAGMLATAIGGALAVWCVLAFVVVGHGTPAPFDPPRRLVARGPYRYVRNPMYLGATIALAGAALFYGSPALAVYAAVFLIAMHAFVVLYEEPTLRASFGQEYERYCDEVRRWWPRLR